MMKRMIFSLLVVVLFCSCSDKQESMSELIDRAMNVAIVQYKDMNETLRQNAFPKTTAPDGSLETSGKYWWCSGFYPGTLWYLYEYSLDTSIRNLAEEYTEMLDSLKFVTNDHDVGFQLYCSYGNGLRLTGNPDYKEVLYTGAHSLYSRFKPSVGCIKSWDNKKWSYPVIIDNMMNLELLMFVAKNFDCDSLKIASCKHANTTMKNHFRDNYSTYHLVDYNPVNGSIIRKQTVQGLSDGSSWARGQAWALYGYTMMFRETGTVNYLEQAQHVANYLINHPNMPKDCIPYWDFNTTDADDYRDSSAAAIMASALIELSTFIKDKDISQKYLGVAETQLRELASDDYLAAPRKNNHFILMHGVGNLPGNQEVDVPLTYGDYYFVEALMRYDKMVLDKNMLQASLR